MQIPGISHLIDKGTIPESLLLLTGPIGAGKSVYCRQFLADGLLDRDFCIYISSTLTNKQFRTQFSNIENLNLIQNSKFINPYLYSNPVVDQRYRSFSSDSSSASDNNTGGHESIDKLSLTLREVQSTIPQINRMDSP